jgi:hypothetical protein
MRRIYHGHYARYDMWAGIFQAFLHLDGALLAWDGKIFVVSRFIGVRDGSVRFREGDRIDKVNG